MLGVVAMAVTALSARAGDAKALYGQNCTRCHGADGKGETRIGKKLGVKDYTDPKVQAALTDKEITETIKNGKPGTAMPAFGDKLSDDQISSLVKYIRSLDSSKKK